MNLPNYQLVQIKNSDLTQISELLNDENNLKRPVVYVVNSLNLDEQREVIGVIENWYDTNEISWRVPYPVYIISDLTEAVGHITVVSDKTKLPKFFNIKEGKITVKESQVLNRNKLLTNRNQKL
jgi:hypothetical protein